MERALFVGRFQPFHNGHKKSIEQILEEVDEAVIAIGSADSSHTNSNPFTAGERIEMIHESFKNRRDELFFIPIVDIERNALWVKHIESFCPEFSVIYTNNKLVSQLFSEEGFEVKNHGLMDRNRLSGTEVRTRIANDTNWEELVPQGTTQKIREINGTDRIQDIER